ncbi:MAG TPA: tRNA (adenosine(37)-N6)-threonylcarbamoyltransferase complex dimerization subunit type 1 TsaB [Chloroflexota bacterium]|nr:tRNA (adenosine(37)-N6)-threonylcarbamoyltransferase complex dimerization subunit type 1 TsaB [Chloroflexota bacterium]
MLLALDTATHYASVALHDGERLLAEQTWLANHDHTRTLLPHVQALLADAHAGMDSLSALAVALGPGSFNGLRVGLSTAKGLAIALKLPLTGASTLELLAAEYDLAEVAMNASRGRVYRWSTGGDIELIDGAAPNRVRHAGTLAELGWQRLREGHTLDVTKVEPIYVQPPHITESRKKAHMQAA